MRVAALCGGVGAARLLRGLVLATEPAGITAITNVGDDCDLHGLSISPDLDTITYTVSGSVNRETGWGLSGETWQAMGALRRFADVVPSGSEAGSTWFGLGDRDLATHLYRTGRRREGALLSEITAEIARAFGLGFGLLPVTDDVLRTRVVVDGDDLDFQSWFVGRHHSGTVSRVTFDGADDSRPAPGVIEALHDADRIVISPSNPLVSIGPVLAVPDVGAAVAARRDDVVAVSPIVGGDAIKGPAATMLADLGHEVSPVGVARILAPHAGTLVIDVVDEGFANAVAAEGVRCVVAPSVMHDDDAASALALVTLSAR